MVANQTSSTVAQIPQFEDSQTWQSARQLFIKICSFTSTGEFAKDFRFRSQIEAASGSIMDNIAEGFERGGNRELIQFLIYSKGSAGEVRSQIHRAADRNHISQEAKTELINDVLAISRMLQKWINYLKASNKKGPNRRPQP